MAHYDISYDFQVNIISWSSVLQYFYIIIRKCIMMNMQGETVNAFSKSNLKSIGFTGVEVFNETVEDVFKGTTAEESFLYITVIDMSSKFKHQ